MSTEQTPSTPTKITTSLEEEEKVEDAAAIAAATESPLHMHVALGAVLPGKPLPSHNNNNNNLSSRSSSRSRTSLRSNSRSPSSSPSPQHYHQQLQVLSSTASSNASMEFVDEDILTDKMGMLELESQPCHVKPLLEQQGKKLPSVNERMSEESLDDVHAFSDLRNVIRQIKTTPTTNYNSNNNSSSIGNSLEKESGNSGTISSASSDGARSIGGSSYVDQGHLLETLLEFEEDEDEEEDDDDTTENDDTEEQLKKKLKKKKSSKSHRDKLKAKE
jgi:hypothetical protein